MQNFEPIKLRTVQTGTSGFTNTITFGFDRHIQWHESQGIRKVFPNRNIDFYSYDFTINSLGQELDMKAIAALKTWVKEYNESETIRIAQLNELEIKLQEELKK